MIGIIRTAMIYLMLLIPCAIVPGGVLTESQRAKLHPAFQALVEDSQNNQNAQSVQEYLDAIILTSNAQEVRNAGIAANSVYRGFVTARVRIDQLALLASLQAVSFVDPGSTNELHTEVSVPETGAPLLHGGFVNQHAVQR